ncbi:sulfite exporter TauE/SafE family protein [Caulobacter segnis]|uniref:sulfite exporter TauE/SafE family protein n=1 Tax=Caulobacter segnis TaxID=88688 RepID=UPI002410326A|nr:sulfite exporter TauE/SafE family protein [Caulobacter segnis]MDG2522927.1 sulfite exporter TauE/SafE family protein [Caulobacter segnis]
MAGRAQALGGLTMAALDLAQYALGGGAGALVGFTLGLVGGGGSILAVPLLVYVVGVPNPHLAIGTSACAVALNAGSNLVRHARLGNVKWRCALLFAAAGVLGAAAGSSVGKLVPGERLLALFALVMLAASILMFRRRHDDGDLKVELDRKNAPRLAAAGGAAGLVSGFFGIGGGFLVVPGLVAATRMPMMAAIGSSLVAVTAFGLTTAFNYALSGWVDWLLAGAFVAGGVFGGALGARAGVRLSQRRGALNMLFAGLLVVVALAMLAQTL